MIVYIIVLEIVYILTYKHTFKYPYQGVCLSVHFHEISP